MWVVPITNIYCIYFMLVLYLCALEKTSCRHKRYQPCCNQQNPVQLPMKKLCNFKKMCSFNVIGINMIWFITTQVYISKLKLLKWRIKSKDDFSLLEMGLIRGCVCWSWVNTLCLRIDFRVNKMFVPSGKLCWPKVCFTLFQLQLKIILHACCCSWKLIGRNIC